MTLTKVWKKLRERNWEQYRQFYFCVGFAVMLVSSYLLMLNSPLVQKTLPDGGDSRKQVYMMLCLAMVGCMIFVVYAANLFLRYKSREIGVFLALGTDKGKLSKALFAELGKCTLVVSVVGLAAGGVVSFLVGKLFEAIAKGAAVSFFVFTGTGWLYGILYTAVLFGVIMILTARFLKRSNIMDILNEHRKQEPLKRQVSFSYLLTGIVLTVLGVVIGFVVPNVIASVFHHWLGGWTNFFYILTLWGLYRIMVYSVSCHKKGRNPQKYYKHLVSYGLLKFQGASIVRNMLVITLLLLGGMFAVFYTPSQMNSMNASLDAYEAMYSYCYTEDAEELSKNEVFALAADYGVQISNYREAEFLQVLGSGVDRDHMDESGNLLEQYEKKHAVYECISASQYEQMTGQKASVEDGTYYMIQSEDAYENVFNRFDDMDQIYLEREDSYLPMEYQGNVIYQSLLNGDWGFDINARFVVSDGDYKKIAAHTMTYPRVKQVLFDSDKPEKAVEFNNELYKIFAQRMSDSMKVGSNYDAYKAKTSEPDSMYAMEAIYDADNPVKESDWQYEPTLLVLKEKNGLMTYAVYLLIFLYVSVICLAAVVVVAYARSQSVGLSSRQVFEDLEKLGADHGYLRRILRSQIQKVYFLPTLVGGLGILAFEILMYQINDGRLTKQELKMLPVLAVITLIMMAFQYLMYRASLHKVQKELSLL